MSATSADHPRSHALSLRLTVALAAFGAIAPVAIDMFLPGVPAMAAELEVAAARGGTSMSVFFIGMAVGQLFAGPMSDRIGRRPMIVGGLWCFIAGGLAAAFSQSFTLLLAARIVQALGACSVTTSSRAAVRDMLDAREAFVSAPGIKQFGSENRYFVCLRAEGNDWRKEKFVVFHAGKVNQLIDAIEEQCDPAGYESFPELLPELNKPRQKK